MKLKTKTSITRRSDFDGNHLFSIEVSDVESGLRIIDTVISAHDFALAISGFSYQESNSMLFDNRDYLGKSREVERVVFNPKSSMVHKDELRTEVSEHFNSSSFAADGWKIHSDGTRERQDGKGHRYTIIRFVENEPTSPA